MSDEGSNQSNQPSRPNDKGQGQTQDQETPAAPTVLPPRNPETAWDHAMPQRDHPITVIKTPKKGDMEK
jgi:hypothetical protein